MGRKQRAAHRPAPLIRAKTADLVAAGVERTPRTIGVRNGRPQLEDGRELEAANVVWCTGFRPDFSWIRLPVFAEPGAPSHRRGVVGTEPGLYFVGLHFLYAMSSTMVHGVGRDARYVADIVAARVADAVRGVRARAERREQSR
jgi:putative flavoprotein involved in K+ transport